MEVSALTAAHLNLRVHLRSPETGDGVQGRLFAVRHERAWSVLELSVLNQSITLQVPHAGSQVALTLIDPEPEPG